MSNKHLFFLLLCLLPVCGLAQRPVLQEYVNLRQYQQVVAYADSLTQADSADYVTMSAIGQAYEGLLQYQNAYRCYEHCFHLDTTNNDALSQLARMAMNVGKAAVAKQCFQKVLQRDSADFFANYQLGRLYAQQGDYEQAIAQYDVLRNQDSTAVNPVIYRNIADCYMQMNAVQAAALCYFQAYNVNRENAGLANALVNCLLRMGETGLADALQICDTALYYNPGNRALLRSKAMGCYMGKRYSTADSIYKDLLAAGDSSFLTLKYGGASRYLANYAFDAIPLLEAAYAKDTTDVETTLLLGAALGKTYDRRKALALFDRAERLMQPDPAWVNLLLLSRCETLWADGQGEKANRLIYEAWKKQPERLDYLFRLEQRFPNTGKSYQDSPEWLANALFVKHLFLTECLAAGRYTKYLHLYRNFLEYVQDDAFFQNKSELEMIAPDGKRGRLTVEELKQLLGHLPLPLEEE